MRRYNIGLIRVIGEIRKSGGKEILEEKVNREKYKFIDKWNIIYNK